MSPFHIDRCDPKGGLPREVGSGAVGRDVTYEVPTPGQPPKRHYRPPGHLRSGSCGPSGHYEREGKISLYMKCR